jgi:hypothetical protein
MTGGGAGGAFIGRSAAMAGAAAKAAAQMPINKRAFIVLSLHPRNQTDV